MQAKYLFIFLLFVGAVFSQTATLLTHEFNGSATIANAQTNFRLVDSFEFTNPFSTPTTFYIYTSVTAYAQGDFRAEFDIYDANNALSIGSTTRTMNADRFGSLMIISEPILFSGGETKQINIRHRKIDSTSDSLITSNVTSVGVALRDLNTNDTIPNLVFDITNSTNNTDFVAVGYANFTQSIDGYIYVDISDTQLNSSISTDVQYHIQINDYNCSIIQRGVNGSGSTGSGCINPTLTTEGTDNNITIYAKTSDAYVSLNITNGIVYTYPTDNYLQQDFTGLSITSNEFEQIANDTVGVVANQSLETSVYLSINSTDTTNMSFYIRLFNESGDTVKDSLTSTNSLFPNGAKVSLIKMVFENLTTQQYTVALYTLSSNGDIHIVGGSGVAVLGKATPVTESPVSIKILYPANNTVFGPGQCSIDLEILVESSYTIADDSVVCSLYSWSGNTEDNYTYIENRTTQRGFTNFTYNITPSETQFFKFVCAYEDEETQEIEFQVIGQSFCEDRADETTTYTYSNLFDDGTYSNAFGILNILIGLYIATSIIINPKV